MATQYSDQFYVLDPASPGPPGTWLEVQTLSFVDRSGDGKIDRWDHDTIDGHRVTHVWNGDTVTVDLPGQGVVTVTGVTLYAKGMKPVFTPTDGTDLQDARLVGTNYVTQNTSLDLDDLAPACFTPGTLIETEAGAVPVEQIGIGDRVLTLDHGTQPVRWTGRRRVRAQGRFAPVRFATGALGNTRPLTVSPQHRILVQGWAAELYGGQASVLVAARHLVDGRGVCVRPGKSVEYLHLGFSGHALVRSEGIWTESHFASAAGRAEAAALFPGHADGLRLARPEANAAVSRVLAASLVCRAEACGL